MKPHGINLNSGFKVNSDHPIDIRIQLTRDDLLKIKSYSSDYIKKHKDYEKYQIETFPDPYFAVVKDSESGRVDLYLLDKSKDPGDGSDDKHIGYFFRVDHDLQEKLMADPNSGIILGEDGHISVSVDDATIRINSEGKLYSPSASKDLPSMRKIEDYFYEAYFGDLDYAFAKEWFNDKYDIELPLEAEYVPENLGLCSSVRKGNFIGRNFDWLYDDSVEFLIRTPHRNDRFATVGITGALEGMTKDFVDSRVYSDLYKILPFRIVDGINEYGLECNVNVTPMWITEKHIKSIPVIEKKVAINGSMITRYILDHFKSARKAAEYIRDYVEVDFSEFIKNTYQFHVMLADKSETIILEFDLTGKGVILSKSAELPEAMTNFWKFSANIMDAAGHMYPVGTSKEISGLTDHAAGVERYNKIIDAPKSSLEDIKNCMRSVSYRKMYDLDNGRFFSEFVGIDNLTIESTPEEFLNSEMLRYGISKAVEALEAGDRHSKATPWQTVHSVVYDIDERCAYVDVQEQGTYNYKFEFDILAGSSIDEDRIIALENSVVELNSEVESLDYNKVDKVEGKDLSTNDFTDELKEKLELVDINGEENVIESITINGGDKLPVVDKNVDITIPDVTIGKEIIATATIGGIEKGTVIHADETLASIIERILTPAPSVNMKFGIFDEIPTSMDDEGFELEFSQKVNPDGSLNTKEFIINIPPTKLAYPILAVESGYKVSALYNKEAPGIHFNLGNPIVISNYKLYYTNASSTLGNDVTWVYEFSKED